MLGKSNGFDEKTIFDTDKAIRAMGY